MLQITWTTAEPTPVPGQLLVVPLRADHDPTAIAPRFGKGIADGMQATQFHAKPGESFVFTRLLADDALERVLVLGVGALGEASVLRTLAHDAVRHAHGVGATRVVLDLRAASAGELPWTDGDAASSRRGGELVAQGSELGCYAYERFIAEDKRGRRTVRELIVWADSAAPGEATKRGTIVAAAIAKARDLVNGPAGLVTPTYLAGIATEIAESLRASYDVAVRVLDRKACEELNMGCFLGVAQGSDEPPQFIHLSSRPRTTSRGRVCLIGKGVTFDSGGYSLKPTEGMLDMKMDMAGSAAVLAAFEAIVRLELPWEVHAVVAATENMVSGRAYRLGDVLVASNGKTVEINNTDAEGRLTLADAMVYCAKLEPDLMIDFATLTGACMVALGPKIAGVMAKDDALAEDWLAASTRSGEAMWRLPLPDDLKEQLKSKVADMKNTGERWGGALTAGLFLSEFTEGRRWLHVDIAGPAMASKAYGVTTPGGTGFPVATIVEFLSGDVRLRAP